MLRTSTSILALLISFSPLFAQEAEKKQPPAAPVVDEIGKMATQLEGQLGKFNDAAPEAADIMVQLVDLYHQNGRVFGLIRSAQRFVTAHPTDKRHQAVMLKLIDGLEAASRNKDTAVYARQFVARYPKAPECADIDRRLAATLDRMGQPDKTGEAYLSVWQREPTAANRHNGFLASARFSAHGSHAVITQGAEVATELLEKLPVGDFTEHIGWRAFWEYRRISQWAKSNVVGKQMLAKGLPRKPDDKWTLHRYIAENYWNQSQHANSVVSIRAAEAIKPDRYLHYQLIERLYHAGAKAAELEPVVNQYFQRYPDSADRFSRRILVGMAYMRETNNAQAAQVFASAMPFDAVYNSCATYFVRTNGAEPTQLAQTERVLLDAIAKNKPHAAYLRYTLGFEVYRDRLKDVPKTRSIMRDLVVQSPTDDGHVSGAISYLLSTAPNDQEFQADFTRILKARRDNPHWGNLRGYPMGWVKGNKKTKDEVLKKRVDYATAELAKADADPIIVKWNSLSGNPWSAKQGAIRADLLAPENKRLQSKQALISLLNTQAYYHQHYAPGNQRADCASDMAEYCVLEPQEYQAAYNYLVNATDYSPKEVRKEAAINFMKFEPVDNNSDIWRRLLNAADANADEALVKQSFAWIQKSRQKYGKSAGYGSYIGDMLIKYKLEAEAVAYWTDCMTLDRNYSESRECALRLIARITKTEAEKVVEDTAKRIPFVQELFKHDTDFHGRYATWLANDYIKLGDLDNAIKVLRESIRRQDERPFRATDMYVWDIHYMLHNYYANMENTAENKKRLAEVVRDLNVGWPSAQATAMLLDAETPGARPQMARLLDYQRITLRLGSGSHEWDQLFGYAQGAVTRKDYSAAAAMLTGMLTNIAEADAARKQRGRDMIAQCYSRMGSVGLTIDEKSPIAPLLQAALYLRLGDRSLAFETYLANRTLFNAHRSEVPIDLLLFICNNHAAAGGDENHDLVEDILRGWQVKNTENAAIEKNDKARVQLMLAKNFYQARRYEIARSEYTT
ncbi:MAG: hypothetical protein O3A00_02450, partial [Planctomycetota bacterium]|nr:hypothetical protein [Planctomycetota bacterium]